MRYNTEQIIQNKREREGHNYIHSNGMNDITLFEIYLATYSIKYMPKVSKPDQPF